MQYFLARSAWRVVAVARADMTDYFFGSNPEFELQVRERRLLSNGQPVPLGSRALDVLIALVENAGELVSRRKLIDRVWGNLAVEENNLNVQVNALRKTLGSHLIATIPGRGYCFTPRPSTTSLHQAGYTSERLKSNLPASLPRLIGREDEIAELDELTQAHRLVTILGAGGIGKTLLAQHLLRRHEARFRHGVCFVDLSTLPDAKAIPGVIAAALRIQPSGGDSIAGLADAIEPLEVMVVLDGAERVLEGVAHVARSLHDAAPGLRLLVTSQAPLKLAAERLHRVSALAFPRAHMPAKDAMSYGAIALFVDRARASDSRFVLTDEAAPTAIDLCAALDGLPLAIELAAWRAPTLGVQGLVESMHEPLKLLATSNLDVPRRLQALRNALAWSHGLLDAREQIVLRRLSVLVGCSDLGLIQSVVSDPMGEGAIDESAAVDALSTLVERSLVAVVPGWRAEVRYKMLDTPKAFAKEQLVAANEEALIAQRHARALASRFRLAHQERFSGDVGLGEWQERQLPEIDNGHAALEWMRTHDEIDLALTLLPGLMHSTPREEAAKHTQMITLGGQFAERAQASTDAMWTLLESSQLVMNADARLAHALADKAVRMAGQCAHLLEDDRWLYRGLCQRATALLNLAETREGKASLVEARAVEQADWPAIVRMQRWLTEVWLADRLGDGEQMYLASLRFHALSREAGLPGWASGLCMVNGALAGGRAEEAVRYGLLVVEQLEGTRHLAWLAETRLQLVGALIECQRLDEARLQSRAAWPAAARFARPDAWADYQALLAALEGRPADAALLHGFANRVCAREHIERTHNELAAVRRTTDILVQCLGEAEMKRLIVLGEGLRHEDLSAIAFGTPLGPDDNAAKWIEAGRG